MGVPRAAPQPVDPRPAPRTIPDHSQATVWLAMLIEPVTLTLAGRQFGSSPQRGLRQYHVAQFRAGLHDSSYEPRRNGLVARGRVFVAQVLGRSPRTEPFPPDVR